MATDLKPGWTRYWCLRCRRALRNDASVKTDPRDTVSPHPGGGFIHDACGGEVALSSREIAA